LQITLLLVVVPPNGSRSTAFYEVCGVHRSTESVAVDPDRLQRISQSLGTVVRHFFMSWYGLEVVGLVLVVTASLIKTISGVSHLRCLTLLLSDHLVSLLSRLQTSDCCRPTKIAEKKSIDLSVLTIDFYRRVLLVRAAQDGKINDFFSFIPFLGYICFNNFCWPDLTKSSAPRTN